MKIIFYMLVTGILAVGVYLVVTQPDREPRVLLFSKTTTFDHQTIPAAQEALTEIAAENRMLADTTTNAALFTDDFLRGYDAVVFLYTTGDVLDDVQQEAFMRFIQAGGGYMGIHSASDTEFRWPWYGRLVGGYFISHPTIQEAKLSIVDTNHPATQTLPDTWIRTDEWYNIRYTNPDVNVLITIDESSYDPRDNEPGADPHPLAWYHEFDGGRSFYTALGHVKESYSEPLFRDHISGGLRYVVGDGSELDYDRPGVLPSQTGFKKIVLDENLNEPMELDQLPDGRILFIERRGDLKVYDPEAGRTDLVVSLDVYSELEDGLLGLAIDPEYEQNSWIYLYYSPPFQESKQKLSRFTLDGSPLSLHSESVLLEVETQRVECCHSGGSLEFGPGGTLFLSTGDNTNPFASDGFSPIDEQPGRSPWDAQRSAANSNDLRGKILRVQPTDDGEYVVPGGNLFPSDGSVGRPEIYIMGNRNPFRISIDSRTGFLYWGEVGPDATESDPERGPKGHDEINQAREPGFYGWPYFVANNKPYVDFDFGGGRSLSPFDALRPVNRSPNNTGLQTLPPAQPAFIWYPYDASPEFPLIGEGGRTGLAGPVYYFNDYEKSDVQIPEYYDGKLIIYEWMRHQVFAITMDGNDDYAYMERFAPNVEFSRPTDMIIGLDGVLYLLEYGTIWNARNPDARLVRLEFDPSR
ncbi:MAG: hypothetical protein BMS9Abin05_0132 [Rhodothermia bacterium]|nr:MAG: hypothetical protein BMS9Abin05_0132 [Rhodothermia bacterium]